MKGSDMARLSEINMLSEAITKVEVIDFDDANAQRDSFLVAAKKNLNELLTMFDGK